MNNIDSIFNVLYSQELSESTKSDILENLVNMCGDSLLYSTITESEFEHEDLLEFYWNVSHSGLSEDVRNFIVDEVLSTVDENTINVVTDEFIKMSVQEAIYNYYNQPMSLTEEIINEVSFGKKLGVALGRLGQSAFAKAPEAPKDPIGLKRIRDWGKKLDRFEKTDFGEKARRAFKSAGTTAGENIGKALTNLVSKKKSNSSEVEQPKVSEPKEQRASDIFKNKGIEVKTEKTPDLKSKIKGALTTTDSFRASDIFKNKAKNAINKVADSVNSQVNDINKNKKEDRRSKIKSALTTTSNVKSPKVTEIINKIKARQGKKAESSNPVTEPKVDNVKIEAPKKKETTSELAPKKRGRKPKVSTSTKEQVEDINKNKEVSNTTETDEKKKKQRRK